MGQRQEGGVHPEQQQGERETAGGQRRQVAGALGTSGAVGSSPRPLIHA